MESNHTCAEINYYGTHSDICGDINSPYWRELLHQCLDEWLDKSDGDGFFSVGTIASEAWTENVTELVERVNYLRNELTLTQAVLARYHNLGQS